MDQPESSSRLHTFTDRPTKSAVYFIVFLLKRAIRQRSEAAHSESKESLFEKGRNAKIVSSLQIKTKRER